MSSTLSVSSFTHYTTTSTTTITTNSTTTNTNTNNNFVIDGTSGGTEC